MAAAPGAGAPRYTSYQSVQAYNSAFPNAQMPTRAGDRNALRSFTRAGAGLEDDLTGSGVNHTLDFLPGGAPEPGDAEPGGPDRVGTVVASRWGNGPYLALADKVSLRAAWKAIIIAWPDRLSAAVDALRPVIDAGQSPAQSETPTHFA
ncbi:hypothetical protein [Amycolatopsis sp. FDAARGOS 1241]|uniref:hypothetical protein n=1 Tax=Amycolatopsis sp. FDAARGOS 1241 TaxID=2778070 RepID=UPI00194F3948|nr:hypothetical protein [Amycolatopsis sp. FDAARGOS 1241]QRP42928.1 hypothetical protein I6J71_26090 [Amycolatopsis sp. FDAARGOS 1241]